MDKWKSVTDYIDLLKATDADPTKVLNVLKNNWKAGLQQQNQMTIPWSVKHGLCTFV